MRIHHTQNGENSGLKRAWNYIWNKGTEEDQEDLERGFRCRYRHQDTQLVKTRKGNGISM
jgi:hypothetical protein